jgi:hypothetical protein
MNRIAKLVDSVENTLQLQSRIVIAVISFGLFIFVASLVATLIKPMPMVAWLDGTLVGSLDRIRDGGPFYPPTTGAMGATLPYPPGTLGILTALSFINPFGTELLPRMVGIASTLFFAVVLVIYAVRLGVRPITGIVFVLVVFTFPLASFARLNHDS